MENTAPVLFLYSHSESTNTVHYSIIGFVIQREEANYVRGIQGD